MNVMADYLAELIHAQFEARKPSPVPEGVTFREIDQIAERGHMDYLLLGALLKLDEIPEDYVRILRGRVMRSIVQTVTQVSELKELLARYEKEGIVNQPMKGARMKFIYPAPEMREMSDIDILIRHDCMDRAAVELKGMGYELYKSIKHHDIYVKRPFMTIEAHRTMYDKTVDLKQYRYFSDFSRARLVEGSAYTYHFNADDFYIYMIAHMAKHFYTMGCGIRNLLDIYVYLNEKGSEMDREYVDTELRELGLYTFTKQMEELAYLWMEKKTCTELQQQIFDYMVDGGIYGKDENGIWNKFAEEKGQEVSIHKLRRWYFFPPVSYMSEYYPRLEKHPFLLPLAWVIRACRGIFCGKGIHKREMLKEIDCDQIKVYQKIYQKMELHFK